VRAEGIRGRSATVGSACGGSSAGSISHSCMHFWQEYTSEARISWCNIAPCDSQTGHLMMARAVAVMGEPVPLFTEVRERMLRAKSEMRRMANSCHTRPASPSRMSCVAEFPTGQTPSYRCDASAMGTRQRVGFCRRKPVMQNRWLTISRTATVRTITPGFRGSVVSRMVQKIGRAPATRRGKVGAGQFCPVASSHAQCAAIPRAHLRRLSEPPPKRRHRLSPGGASDPQAPPERPTASPDRCPAPSARGARQNSRPAGLDRGGQHRTPDTISRCFSGMCAGNSAAIQG